jgi:type II secretory pathway pseudopilin PulG
LVQTTSEPNDNDKTGVMMRARGDGGETLVEILFTVVIIGLTVTALISALGTAGNAGNVQRNSVQADLVMRNYAEATKAAAQGCPTGVTFAAVYPSPLPSGFNVAGGFGICPSVNSPLINTLRLTLTVTGPSGLLKIMQMTVRTP